MTDPAHDTRSIAELWEAACQVDDDATWNAVAALQWRGSKEVLDRAVVLTRASDPASRGRGANVLGQLGLPERTFPDESFSAVLPLLEDQVLAVVCDAIYALQNIDRERAVSHIIPLAQHGDDSIRRAVACGLCAVDAPGAQEVLLMLMADRDPDVRNWATFGIGQQSDVDTDQIRAALADALSDEEEEVRYEAIIGLGRRRDSRATGYLKLLLHEDPDDIFAQEAAAKLVGLSESGQTTTAELLGMLQRLQRWSGGNLPRSL